MGSLRCARGCPTVAVESYGHESGEKKVKGGVVRNRGAVGRYRYSMRPLPNSQHGTKGRVVKSYNLVSVQPVDQAADSS